MDITYIQFLSGYLFPSPIADINRDFTPEDQLMLKCFHTNHFLQQL